MVALALWAGASHSAQAADEQVQAFAGGQLDNSRFAFAGATVALPGQAIGRGFALRASGFGGDYDYSGGPVGGRVDATFTGAELTALYQLSRGSSWISGGLGARYVGTTLSPFDRGNRRHGAQVELSATVNGGTVSGRWRVDYYGSYGARLEDYTARASLTHAVGAKWRAGAEVSFEGDPTYNLQRVGPYVGVYIDQRTELQASAGVSHQSGEGESGYLRLAVVHDF